MEVTISFSEKSMEIQRQIGADIFMALMNVHLILAEYNQAKLSMELTHRWLKDVLIGPMKIKRNLRS